MTNSLKDHRDHPGEERIVPLWVKEAAVKVVPAALAGAALFVFLKYGVLIALMAIFSGLVAFFVLLFAIRWSKKLFRK